MDIGKASWLHLQGGEKEKEKEKQEQEQEQEQKEQEKINAFK